MNKNIIEARYWNTGGIAIAIIAVVTENIDWAAYIGANKFVEHEEDAIEWTMRWGAKLSELDARHFFADMDLPYRL